MSLLWDTRHEWVKTNGRTETPFSERTGCKLSIWKWLKQVIHAEESISQYNTIQSNNTIYNTVYNITFVQYCMLGVEASFLFLTHLCRIGLFFLNSLDRSIFKTNVDWLVFMITMFSMIGFLVCNANSTDPDQTPRSAASDLGLHCLLMSILGDANINGLS